MTGKRESDDRTDTPNAPGGSGVLRLRLDELIAGIAFMTRLPLPYRAVRIANAVWAFPIAGLVVGGVAGLVLAGCLWLGLPPLFAAFAAFGASAYVTGALHEDGLSDCADGFWSAPRPERRLDIMRDSRIGAFGTLALVVATGMKVSLLAAIAAHWGAYPAVMVLIATHVLGRAGLPAVMHLIPAPTDTGLAAMAGRPGAAVVMASGLLGVGIAGAALSFLPVWLPLALAGGTVVALVKFALLAKAKLGGVNGDALGAMEQMSEIAVLAVFAAVMGV